MHKFLKFILGMRLYMFRTVPLSILRSFSLYTQQWYMSYRSADSLRAGSGWNALISRIYSWNKTLHVSNSYSIHHQEFFTVHTAMVYVIQVCWQLASRIRMERINFSILFLEWNSTCFGQFSVHHQEFFTVHTAMVCVIQVCWQLASRIRMECTNFSNLFLEWNSTCFGKFCPSSGVFHCTHSNGMCHTDLLTACEQNQDGTH